METSTAIRRGEHSSDLHVINEFSTAKSISFAIVIILGLGGLAVAGAGVSGYLHK